MENKPLISVIVPVYNVEKYVEECLASVINQTYENLEILVIDDGSTDKSYDVCLKIAKTDSRIKLFHVENNGVSSARNLGIKYASGKYLVFLDSDDYIEPECYENLYNNLIKFNAQCSSIGYIKLKENGTFTDHKGSGNNILCLTNMETLDCAQDKNDLWVGYVWNKLFIREILLEKNITFDENLIFCEDSLFCYRYIEQCNRVVRDLKKLYVHRVSSSSITSSIYKDNAKLSKFPKAADKIYLFAKKYDGRLFYENSCNFCIDLYVTFLFYRLSNGYFNKEEIIEYLDKINIILKNLRKPNLDTKKRFFLYCIHFSPKLTYRIISLIQRND